MQKASSIHHGVEQMISKHYDSVAYSSVATANCTDIRRYKSNLFTIYKTHIL